MPMTYADVILPLPLEGCFTYAVPAALHDRVVPGVRVVVPFGRSKTYTAVVLQVHANKPSFDTRDIISVADGAPVVTATQLQLWQWIAQYYMSPLGEVYKAAMPAGLKNDDRSRVRTERCVTLSTSLRSSESLGEALEVLEKLRAHKQKAVLEVFLAVSRWDEAVDNDGEGSALTVEELRNESRCSDVAIRELIRRGFLTLFFRDVGRVPVVVAAECKPRPPLSPAQRVAADAIEQQFADRNVVLMNGVTSSGKTEIYIHLIEKTIAAGRQVLYMLPEIALTVQMTQRLRAALGGRMAVYHSKYSDAERVEIWRRQLSDEPYDVVLGARSALFLPFRRLGLVIVDEEHEGSYKQQEPTPRYHARSAAIVLAQMSGAKVVLGTATPSAESWHNAHKGKYGYVSLTERYGGAVLPDIRLVDIKDLRRRKMMKGPFSPVLLDAVHNALSEGRQAMLFLNRRGFAPVTECAECGWVPKCSACDVSLTLHKSSGRLTCHYCGAVYSMPSVCPQCGGALRSCGYGTEKIEEAVREFFPDAGVARMDLDTTRTRPACERIIDAFSSGRTDILIGTQMITKGLDFGNVGVVGILDADAMMNYPDFRAHEHAFTMISQVSGRAGRRNCRGLVIVQTRNIESPLMRQIEAGDAESFYASLLRERRAFRYPPFTHIIYIYMRHADENTIEAAAMMMASRLRTYPGSVVLGPDKPVVARVRRQHIRKIMLKVEPATGMTRTRAFLREAQAALSADGRFGAVTIHFDVDPE